MKFKQTRIIICSELEIFSYKAIRKKKIRVPKTTSKNLIEIAAISREIRRYGLPKHLVIKKLKGKLGHGIFLHPKAEPIPRGAVIAPYSGEVCLVPQNGGDNSDYVFSLISDLPLTKEEQRLWDPKNRYHPRRLYSLDVDAHKTGNFTRFINHSDKPNVEAQFLRTPANSLGLKSLPCEIVYMAKKTILPGEQLLICYEGDENTYWGAMQIKPFPMTPKTFQINSSLTILRRYTHETYPNKKFQSIFALYWTKNKLMTMAR